MADAQPLITHQDSQALILKLLAHKKGHWGALTPGFHRGSLLKVLMCGTGSRQLKPAKYCKQA